MTKKALVCAGIVLALAGIASTRAALNPFTLASVTPNTKTVTAKAYQVSSAAPVVTVTRPAVLVPGRPVVISPSR